MDDASPATVGPRAAEAPPILPPEPGEPPIAVLVDFDGTIAEHDVSDRIVRDHLAGDWSEMDARWLRGELGSRGIFDRQAPLLIGGEAGLRATAESEPVRASFAPFVDRCRSLRVAVEVVSDSYGFFIEPALRSVGVEDLPIVTNSLAFGPDGTRMTFPNGHSDCFVCGTCKRNRVLAQQAAGRLVVFVGDGFSDQYAAAHADVVFARDRLVGACRSRGWPYIEWSDFGQIAVWLERLVEGWREDPRSLPAPVRRPFVCGPEIWGPGRHDPPIRRDASFG